MKVVGEKTVFSDIPIIILLKCANVKKNNFKKQKKKLDKTQKHFSAAD